MAFIIDGTTGIATVDGSVSAPSQRGQDNNTGISYAADTIKFSTNGVERMSITNSGVTGAGGGKVVQVKSVSKLDAFTVASPSAHQYYDVTGLDNLQITTTGSNKVIVHMTVHMGIDRDGYNGFFKGIRITSGVYYNLSYPSSTGTSNRASNAGHWTNNLSVPDNYTHAMHIVGFEDSPGAGTHQYGIQIGSSYNRALYTGQPYDGEASGHVYAPSGTITLIEVEPS